DQVDVQVVLFAGHGGSGVARTERRIDAVGVVLRRAPAFEQCVVAQRILQFRRQPVGALRAERQFACLAGTAGIGQDDEVADRHATVSRDRNAQGNGTKVKTPLSDDDAQRRSMPTGSVATRRISSSSSNAGSRSAAIAKSCASLPQNSVAPISSVGTPNTR